MDMQKTTLRLLSKVVFNFLKTKLVKLPFEYIIIHCTIL